MIDISKCEHLIVANKPTSAAAEAFRILRTNLTLRDFDNKIKTINVISASAQESKSTTILNLAYAYSQLNKKVLLIDADLRAPSLHKKLHLKNEGGLTSMITNRTVAPNTFVQVAPNFVFLPAGGKIQFAAELFQAEVFDRLLEAFKTKYDIILIDCPPINLVSDGIIISSKCDGTVFCVASDVNDESSLLKAKAQIEQVDINLLGIVMTRMPVSSKKYGYGYYGYGSEKPGKHKNKK